MGVEIEHIIVDGASSDSTLAIVKQFHHVTKVISEPDNGIYDAMNKGLSVATGDIVGFLNADDFYVDDTVLTQVAKVFEDSSIQACYADLIYVDQNDTSRVIRYWKSEDFKPGLFKQGWMPAHPTFFVRKEVYERLGGFNLELKIAADFELLFRFIEQHRIKTIYTPKVFVKMRLGGTTNKNLSNIVKQNREIILTLKQQHSNFSLLSFIANKSLSRLKQFLFTS